LKAPDHVEEIGDKESVDTANEETTELTNAKTVIN